MVDSVCNCEYHHHRHHQHRTQPKSTTRMSTTRTNTVISRHQLMTIVWILMVTTRICRTGHAPPISVNGWNSLSNIRQRFQSALANGKTSNQYYQQPITDHHGGGGGGGGDGSMNSIRAKLSAFLEKYNHGNDNALKYYYYKHLPHTPPTTYMPTCEELRYLWKTKQLSNHNDDDHDDDVAGDDGGGGDNLLESSLKPPNMAEDQSDELFRQMLKNVPKERQVYITKIVPESKETELMVEKQQLQQQQQQQEISEDNLPQKQQQEQQATRRKTMAIKSEAEKLSPYGIIRDGPSSARRGKSSSRMDLTNGGYFGEFLEEFYPQLSSSTHNQTITDNNNNNNIKGSDQRLERYMNGYNIHSGKQGMKITDFPRIYGRQRSRNRHVTPNVTPSKSSSSSLSSSTSALSQPPSSSSSSPKSGSSSSSPSLSSSSSSSYSSQSSSILMPGFWHEKPVKPSVNLIK